MDRFLYVAMSGAKELKLAQQVWMNNLANVSTHGFREDWAQQRTMPVFGDVLATRVYAMAERPATNFQEGNLLTTGRQLDVAVNGSGWIAVQAPDGSEAYVRTAALQITPQGQVLTETGLPVLGNAGPMTLPAYSQLEIGKDGIISIVPQGQTPEVLGVFDRLRLVNPPLEQLTKGEDGLIRRLDRQPETPDAFVSVLSGALEASNAKPVEQMINVIEAARQYEMSIHAMETARTVDQAGGQLLRLTS
jgi:flagellar basal-body rod protein FlgF